MLGLLAALALVALNGFFVAAEFSMVRVRATYTGPDIGNPIFSFTLGYLDANGRHREVAECSAVVPEPIYNQSEVAHGGSIEANYCLDLPPDVPGTGSLFVEELIDFEERKYYWSEQ